jgi:hypothetical protein
MHPIFIERGIIMELNRYKIIEYITDIENFDMTFELVNIINSYDGSFPEIEYFYNDEEFFGMFFGINTIDAVRAVCFGDYKFEDEFVKYNRCGNLDSANKYEIMNEYNFYKEELADKLIDIADECDIYIDFPEEFYLN